MQTIDRKINDFLKSLLPGRKDCIFKVPTTAVNIEKAVVLGAQISQKNILHYI